MLFRSVAVVVYDITNLNSFQQTKKWVSDVRKERENEVVVFLVGNKTDLVDMRQVSVKEGSGLAKDLDVVFVETSAKEGYNVRYVFRMISSVLSNVDVEENDSRETAQEVTLNGVTKSAVNDGESCSC